MTKDLLNFRSPSWMWESGDVDDVVMTTKVRLSRNIKNFPFPHKMSPTQVEKMMRDLSAHLSQQSEFVWNEWNQLSHHQKRLFLERKMISAQQALDQLKIVGVSQDENAFFYTNQGDHFSFYGLAGGWNWSAALLRAQQPWQVIKPCFQWARHKDFGWVGADPLNWGANLKISVLIHLPALEEMGEVVEVFDLVEEARLSLRGVSTFDKRSLGNLFLISTVGSTGKAILDLKTDMSEVIKEIHMREKRARKLLLQDAKSQLLDKIFRAYGTLEHAYLITEQESLDCLSYLRLGINLGILNSVPLSRINRLYYWVLRGHLLFDMKDSNAPHLDEEHERAKLIQEELKEGRKDDV